MPDLCCNWRQEAHLLCEAPVRKQPKLAVYSGYTHSGCLSFPSDAINIAPAALQ